MKARLSVRTLVPVLVLVTLLAGSYLYTFNLRFKFTKPYSHAAAGPNDWAQVQKNPQRTGFSQETLGTNFKLKWSYTFAPERVFPSVQAIVYDNMVFVGTEHGNLYALDAVTPASGTKGKVLWKAPIGSPILSSVAADSGKVFFGAMDGAVYAVNTADGSVAWRKYLYKGQVVATSPRLGFSAAPLIAENKIMIGGQDGYFYALEPNTGNVLWKYNAGAPLLMTAAYDSGKVFFGSMDMFVHGVNTSNGTGAWKSQKIEAMAFKDYWPVVAKYQDNGITKSVVAIRPMGKYIAEGISPGFPFIWNISWDWLSKWGPTVAAGNLATIPDDTINGKFYSGPMTAQNTVMTDYAANPSKYKVSLQLLDVDTGQQAFAVPHLAIGSIGGAASAPCIDRDGFLIVGVDFLKTGYGRINLNTRRFVDILYDGFTWQNTPISQTNTTPRGGGNSDEDTVVSCSQNQIFMLHFAGNGGGNYTGAFNLDTRTWTLINAAGGSEMALNTQGGGIAPFSISNGMIYNIVFHQLQARTTN